MTGITLPWPPSINHYWRHVGKKVLISAKGRQYRRMIQELAVVERWPTFGGKRLRVQILAYPPDKRRRDLDNMLKVTLDSLQHAGIYTDDSQIDDLRISRGLHDGSGEMIVSIEGIDELH